MTELHPDLVDYAITHPMFGHTVDHPLVRFIPMHDEFGMEMVNACYTEKLRELKKAEKKGDYDSIIFLHERPYRLEALQELDWACAMSGKEFWPLVGAVWIDSGNIWQNSEDWRSIWADSRSYRKRVMDSEDRSAFAALPNEFTIWRGVGHSEGINGLSWTTDRNQAIWFAHRFKIDRTPHLASGRVHKRDVLARFTGGNESEIVVFPDNVKGMKVERLPALTKEK